MFRGKLFFGTTSILLVLSISCSKSTSTAGKSRTNSSNSGESSPYLMGKYTLPENINRNGKPVHIVISKTSDVSKLSRVSEDQIVTIKTANDDGSFKIDPKTEGLKPGDVVSISAFLDNDYANGSPKLTVGDYVGFHFNPGSYSTAYEIKEMNPQLEISVSRKVYDYEKSIDITLVEDQYNGPLLGIIYTGKIESTISSNLDPDGIMGYTSINKPSGNLFEFSIDILPYGSDLPLKDAYIFVIADKNKNGTMDPGEKYGVYSSSDASERGVPTPLTISSSFNKQLVMSMKYQSPFPSGDNVSVSGSIKSSVGSSSEPRYVFVSKAKSIDEFLDSPNEKMQAFIKVKPGVTEFEMDLSETELNIGDKIMVFAMQDNDIMGQFPDLTQGDFVGLYKDQVNKRNSLQLSAGGNKNISLDINKTHYSYTTKLFSIQTTVSRQGDYVLVAYLGSESDIVNNDIDMDRVVSYQSFKMVSGRYEYDDFKTLPFYKPTSGSIDNAYVYIFKDTNSDGVRQKGENLIFSVGKQQDIATQGSKSNILFD